MTAAPIRTTSLRVRLLVLALAASLPVILFAAFIIVQMAADRRARELENLVRRTAAAAAAVDQALFGASRELSTLAVDKDVLEGNLPAAFIEASSFAAQSSIGESISLLTPDGRILFNTRRTLGEVLPPSGDLPGVAEAVATRSLRVSNLYTGALDGRPIVTVDSPAMQGGAVRYVLHMVIDPNKILALLRAQNLDGRWVATVLDRQGNTIARTPDSEGSLGREADESLLRAIAERREGTYEHVLRDGTPVMGAYRRIDTGGWAVSLAVPRAVLDAQRTRFLLLLLGGGGLILAAAAVVTLRLARALEARLREVGDLAGRLGTGEAVLPVATGVRELDAVGQSLARAATLILSREAALTHASKVAKDALASKAKFFAAANHDLRQPVQSLFLFHATLATLLPPDHPAHRPLTFADSALSALQRLLDGLRDVSRLDAGAMVPALAPFALDDVLDALAGEYRLRAADQGICLCYARTGLWVKSDPALLDRVVRNLLENAIRYTPRGGKVLLGCRRRAGHARIVVADSGIGIPADKLGVIFEEFQQLGNPARDSALGLGLGLAIVRRICDLLGHGISVHSTEGRGAAFVVHLPRVERPENQRLDLR